MISLAAEFLILMLNIACELIKFVLAMIRKPQLTRLQGEIVLITGAGQGIGKELALQYAAQGCTVVCLDVNEKESLETAAEINAIRRGTAFSYKCDVSDRDGVLEIARRISAEIGNVSVLVNNAGVTCCRPFVKHTPEHIRRLFNINILAHFWTIEAFLPQLIASGRGQIIALSSIAGVSGTANITGYSATKFAVRGLMDALSKEFRADPQTAHIKFLTIFPSLVDTDMVKTPYFRFPTFSSLMKKEDVAATIIHAHRSGKNEISIPTIYLPFINLSNFLPIKCRQLITQFIRTGLHSEV